MNNSNLINKEENEIQIIMRAFHSLVISQFKNNEYLLFDTALNNITKSHLINVKMNEFTTQLKYYLKLYG